MLSDAPLYDEHHSLQSHDTEVLLSSVISRMDWSRQQQDVVMDIGCGPGSSTRTILLPAFPEVKKMIGVDVIPDMIELANKNNTSEKLEFHVVNIENRSTIEKWTSQISKVVSIHCFNWVKNQEQAFKHIYEMLKPGGEAAMVFTLSTPLWDSYKLHVDNPKYSSYLKEADSGVPESHHEKYGSSHYRSMLENLGFNVTVCEDEKREYAYSSDDDCKASIFCTGLTNYIPDELKSEFKEDLFDGFLKYNGRDSRGRPVLYITVLTVLVQKPNV